MSRRPPSGRDCLDLIDGRGGDRYSDERRRFVRVGNFKSQISNLKSQIAHSKSQISNPRFSNHAHQAGTALADHRAHRHQPSTTWCPGRGDADMAFSARDLARAADIYDRMLRDTECGIILCLAGSLISAGLKKVFVDMIRNRMVDCHRQHRGQHRRSGFLRGPRLPALHRRGAAQGGHGRRRCCASCTSTASTTR